MHSVVVQHSTQLARVIKFWRECVEMKASFAKKHREYQLYDETLSLMM